MSKKSNTQAGRSYIRHLPIGDRELPGRMSAAAGWAQSNARAIWRSKSKGKEVGELLELLSRAYHQVRGGYYVMVPLAKRSREVLEEYSARQRCSEIEVALKGIPVAISNFWLRGVKCERVRKGNIAVVQRTLEINRIDGKRIRATITNTELAEPSTFRLWLCAQAQTFFIGGRAELSALRVDIAYDLKDKWKL